MACGRIRGIIGPQMSEKYQSAMSPKAKHLNRSDVLALDETSRDLQTVRSDGKPIHEPIVGVCQRPAITHVDERGSLCEIFNAAWGFDDEPVVYVYQISLLPGFVKGWVLHLEQDDRLFLSVGRFRLVLFDARKNSSTYRSLNVIEAGEFNRCLVRIPAGVYHAVQNVGATEAMFVNLPTRAYCHEAPDKYRLPLSNDLIPYRFKDARGW